MLAEYQKIMNKHFNDHFQNIQRYVCPEWEAIIHLLTYTGKQLSIEKKKSKIFKGTTQVRSEAAETPQDMIPTMVP